MGPGRNSSRVLRGGSWNNDNPENFRGSYRNHNHPDNRNHNNGFRVSRTFPLAGVLSFMEVRSAQGESRPVPGRKAEYRSGVGRLVAPAGERRPTLFDEGSRKDGRGAHAKTEEGSRKDAKRK